MPLSLGTYLREARLAAGLSLDDLARRLATVPPQPTHIRRDLLELIERDEQPIGPATLALIAAAIAAEEQRSGRVELHASGPVYPATRESLMAAINASRAPRA